LYVARTNKYIIVRVSASVPSGEESESEDEEDDIMMMMIQMVERRRLSPFTYYLFPIFLIPIPIKLVFSHHPGVRVLSHYSTTL
jgi:hypothetical protein